MTGGCGWWFVIEAASLLRVIPEAAEGGCPESKLAGRIQLDQPEQIPGTTSVNNSNAVD